MREGNGSKSYFKRLVTATQRLALAGDETATNDLKAFISTRRKRKAHQRFRRKKLALAEATA